MDLIALSDAWKASIALIAVFGVIFPALMTGLIVFAVAQAAAERQQNLERRAGAARDTPVSSSAIAASRIATRLSATRRTAHSALPEGGASRLSLS